MNIFKKPENLFLLTALFMLLIGILFGCLSSLIYIFPPDIKKYLNFTTLRPMHVSGVVIWILMAASSCVIYGLQLYFNIIWNKKLLIIQWVLWVISILGIYFSYLTKDFGGREYWEFNPFWAIPLAFNWLLFLIHFFIVTKFTKNWPVFVWMWMTGIIFFMFIFIENYLWILPWSNQNIIQDITIQWKANGSIVGSWNQLIYGTAFYLMYRINNESNIIHSKKAFAMYFLGLFNLMFNWGHHIYTLPTEPYIKYIGYLVSMTEWIFFIRIIYEWKESTLLYKKIKHHLAYRFLIASDFWVFVNMGQAILMSIPAFNLLSHGTHITVAHAMGTTIGINTMILISATYIFSGNVLYNNSKFLNISFWGLQISLFVFIFCLDTIGILKGIWQISLNKGSFNAMMNSLHWGFILFVISGFFLLIFLGHQAINLFKGVLKQTSK